MAKIPRWSREVIITEKIDGTNASVIIVKEEPGADLHGAIEQRVAIAEIGTDETKFVGHIFAGSRTRLVVPGKQTTAGLAYGYRRTVTNLLN